jgi:hypothetical protein
MSGKFKESFAKAYLKLNGAAGEEQGHSIKNFILDFVGDVSADELEHLERCMKMALDRRVKAGLATRGISMDYKMAYHPVDAYQRSPSSSLPIPLSPQGEPGI